MDKIDKFDSFDVLVDILADAICNCDGQLTANGLLRELKSHRYKIIDDEGNEVTPI